MESPMNSSEITKDWLEHIFTKYEDRKRKGTTVTVHRFHIKKGCDPGDGFDSELVLVECHATVSKPESSEEEAFIDTVYQVAVKLFGFEVIALEKTRISKGHLKTSQVYSEIIPEMNELLSSFAPDEPMISVPELIYCPRNENEYTLVLENLKANGYKNNDKMMGLDYSRIVPAVNEIAKLHALSYVNYMSRDFLKQYPTFDVNFNLTFFFKLGAPTLLGMCVKLLKSLDREDLSQRLEMSMPSLIKDYESNMQMKGNISCLNHGDYWNNNIMFRYEEGSKPEGIKVIDWTNSYWGNPMYDLHFLIYTSTTGDLRKNHLEEILQQYHSTFTSITAKLGVSVPKWTYEDFKNDWESTFIHGFFSGITLGILTLSKSNSAAQPHKPSMLDHPAFYPIKMALNGLKICVAKLIFRPAIMNLIAGFMLKLSLIPVSNELQAGTNEAMNSRLIDLLCEADEKGLFSAAS